MNNLRRGLFVVFEGLDRSGKTTQAKKLIEFLKESATNESTSNQLFLRFPDRTTELGKTIDSYLKNEKILTDEEIHELFAKNRWERKDLILKELSLGTNIVVDRYAFSGAAYSSAKGLDLEWCKSHDKGLPKPDIVFYIDISESDIAKRPGFGEEKYEKLEFQRTVREKYSQLFDKNYWISIEGSLTQDEMHKVIVEHVLKYMAEFKDSQIQELW